MEKKVVIITGASSGIGKETAILLSKKGYIVYALARRVEILNELVEYKINPYYLDLTNEDSITNAINYIYNKEKRIDILFNNAGYGLYGPVEDLSIVDAKNQFEVNLFGLASITKEVLPIMRNQKNGLIINTSSIGGKIVSPLGAWYHASKFALEGFSDALRLELKAFNIKVVILEPGLIQTEFMDVTYNKALNIKNSAYEELLNKVVSDAKRDYIDKKIGTSPTVVAKKVLKIMESKNPKTRYVVGKLGYTAILSRKLLPDKLLDYIMLRR